MARAKVRSYGKHIGRRTSICFGCDLSVLLSCHTDSTIVQCTYNIITRRVSVENSIIARLDNTSSLGNWCGGGTVNTVSAFADKGLVSRLKKNNNVICVRIKRREY